MQRPSRLIELHQHHARLCWRLGEHAWLKPEDLAQLQVDASSNLAEEVASRKKRKEKKRNAALETCVEITSCHTRVDVIWQAVPFISCSSRLTCPGQRMIAQLLMGAQDGSREMDIGATLLAPAKHVDSYYEFWPQDFIIGNSSGSASEGPAPVGVVQSVNHDQRLCVVTWREDGRREVVPVYEIVSFPVWRYIIWSSCL